MVRAKSSIVGISRENYGWVEREAERLNVTRAAIVNKAIEQYKEGFVDG